MGTGELMLGVTLRIVERDTLEWNYKIKGDQILSAAINIIFLLITKYIVI